MVREELGPGTAGLQVQRPNYLVVHSKLLKRSSSEILISEPTPAGPLWGWPVHKASVGAGVSVA